MIDEETKAPTLRNTKMVRGRAITETNSEFFLLELYIKMEKNIGQLAVRRGTELRKRRNDCVGSWGQKYEFTTLCQN